MYELNTFIAPSVQVMDVTPETAFEAALESSEYSECVNGGGIQMSKRMFFNSRPKVREWW